MTTIFCPSYSGASRGPSNFCWPKNYFEPQIMIQLEFRTGLNRDKRRREREKKNVVSARNLQGQCTHIAQTNTFCLQRPTLIKYLYCPLPQDIWRSKEILSAFNYSIWKTSKLANSGLLLLFMWLISCFVFLFSFNPVSCLKNIICNSPLCINI